MMMERIYPYALIAIYWLIAIVAILDLFVWRP